MAARFAEHIAGDPSRAYIFAALVMVAEHRDTGVVGTLIAYPPLNVAAQLLDRMKRAGYDDNERVKTMLGAGMFLTRIKTVAVAEPARGSNLGGSLLKRAKQVYDHCQYQTIYGAMPGNRGLEAFYRRAGFTVQEPGAGLDLFILFGNDTKIFPEPGERLFSRQRIPR